MRHRHISAILAFTTGFLPAAAEAQGAGGLTAQQNDMFRFLVDNALIGLALFLGLVLALGKSLDFYRSLRARRAGADEDLE